MFKESSKFYFGANCKIDLCRDYRSRRVSKRGVIREVSRQNEGPM